MGLCVMLAGSKAPAQPRDCWLVDSSDCLQLQTSLELWTQSPRFPPDFFLPRITSPQTRGGGRHFPPPWKPSFWLALLPKRHRRVWGVGRCLECRLTSRSNFVASAWSRLPPAPLRASKLSAGLHETSSPALHNGRPQPAWPEAGFLMPGASDPEARLAVSHALPRGVPALCEVGRSTGEVLDLPGLGPRPELSGTPKPPSRPAGE